MVACFRATFQPEIEYTQIPYSSYSFSDVVSIERTGDFFRLLYDVKGRYILHKIQAEEAKVSRHGLLVVNIIF